ncbi:amidohydrolase family protein, partial [candidate division WOR-3 bacterium]|nr:amidohydrolase family protein [candidate division WOR-3 bacterium]
GLQTALSVLWEGLIDKRVLTAERLLYLLSVEPARIIGEEIELKEGADANLFVFNPQETWTFNASSNRSLSCNSPWFGKTLKGKVEHVFLGVKRFEF